MEPFEVDGKVIVDLFLYSVVEYVPPVGKLRRHVFGEVFEGETKQEAIDRIRAEMGLPPESAEERAERIKYESGEVA